MFLNHWKCMLLVVFSVFVICNCDDDGNFEEEEEGLADFLEALEAQIIPHDYVESTVEVSEAKIESHALDGEPVNEEAIIAEEAPVLCGNGDCERPVVEETIVKEEAQILCAGGDCGKK